MRLRENKRGLQTLRLKRILGLAYGLICYLIFFGTFLYAIGFLGNFAVAKTIDSGQQTDTALAVVVNMILLSIFAIQHSVMARQWFKKWWTKIVPKPVERSTYVLFSSLALILLFWLWIPMNATVWDFQNPLIRTSIYTAFGLGWLVVLYSTVAINHFDLFGVRQVWFYFQGKTYEPLKFKLVFPYQYVRHPLYIGWFMTFWAAPTMTWGHLLFATVTSIYILVAVRFEERDLCKFHPEYKNYQEKVPMLCPFSIFFKKD